MSDKKSELDMIMYIKQSIGDLSPEELKNILQIIMNSGIDENKIQEKGNGTQIKYKDIPKETIRAISTYIKNKLDDKMQKLKNFTQENIEVSDEEDLT
jgi:hypothetical protein